MRIHMDNVVRRDRLLQIYAAAANSNGDQAD
jgi:hypothetical protein